MKPIRSRVLNGETLFGCFLNLGSSVTAEIVGQAGFDWVVIDLEHGSGSESDIVHQLQSLEHTSAAAVVRVESHERQRFHRVLDLGAHGIMVPRIDSAAQAQAAVAALNYPPIGVRGVARMNRANGFGGLVSAYSDYAKDSLLGVVQIESPQSLENVDAIAAVPGVDVLFVGPADLAFSLGIPVDLNHPRFQEAACTIAAAAEFHGKTAGILLSQSEDMPQYMRFGFRFIACGSDGTFVYRGAQSMLRELRASVPLTSENGALKQPNFMAHKSTSVT